MEQPSLGDLSHNVPVVCSAMTWNVTTGHHYLFCLCVKWVGFVLIKNNASIPAKDRIFVRLTF